LVALGAFSILYQVFHSDKKEFSLYDFDLGELWPWSEQKAQSKLENSIKNNRERSPALIERKNAANETKRKETAEIVRAVSRVVERKTPNVLPLHRELKTGFQAIKLQELDVPRFVMPSRSGRHLDLSAKEFLIPKDIVNKRNNIAVGASFAPSFTYRNFRYSNIENVARVENQTAYTSGQTEKYRDNNDAAILNFYSGIDVYVHLSNRWMLQTGFYYSTVGEQLQVSPIDQNAQHRVAPTMEDSDPFKNRQALYVSPETDPISGNEQLPFNNYYGFLEIPVNLSYKVAQFKNVQLEVQGGISYALLDQAEALLYNYTTSEYYWIPTQNFEYLNEHFFIANTGIILSQYISEEIELFANPQFKYFLTPTFTSDYEIKQNQLSAGLRLGMKVNL
jgi:hypothetical protein